MPTRSIASRASLLSNRETVVTVVLPSASSKVTVSTRTSPGAPSNSKVETMRSGTTISWYSPWKA